MDNSVELTLIRNRAYAECLAFVQRMVEIDVSKETIREIVLNLGFDPDKFNHLDNREGKPAG